MAQISIRMDDTLKAEADALFEELGLNMSTAFTMFVRQAIREGGIPFDITTKTVPFYSPENQAHLKKVIRDYESGKSKPIVKTLAELQEMEHE